VPLSFFSKLGWYVAEMQVLLGRVRCTRCGLLCIPYFYSSLGPQMTLLTMVMETHTSLTLNIQADSSGKSPVCHAAKLLRQFRHHTGFWQKSSPTQHDNMGNLEDLRCF